MTQATILDLQNIRKLLWVIIIGCTFFTTSASVVWIVTRRVTKHYVPACIGFGFAGVVFAIWFGWQWDNASLADWTVYTIGLSIIAVSNALTSSIILFGMFRR
jgi:thiol:disulfide interchange protein